MSFRPSGVYDVNYKQDMAIYRTRVDWFWGVVILAILLILPLLTRESPLFDSNEIVSVALIGTMTRIFIFIIAVTGLNILVGYTGQISIGHAAFVMVGAYASQILVDQWGLTFWLAMPIAALFTGLIGILFGLPSLRVKGFYLAMATLAAQFIIPWFIKHYSGAWFEAGFWSSFGFISNALGELNLGGATGRQVSAPEFFGTIFRSNLSMYYVALASVIVFGGAARNLIRSRIGRALISVRDNDLAAEQLGINVFRYKLLAFFIAAVYAGIAGSLTAHSARSISPDAFDLQSSINYLGMLIIGGLGFPLGATFGVSFFFIVNSVIIPQIRPFLQENLPN
ncbi:MAG TPA: branched-chain amino acid ABC transporter permease, partial [Aggregatilineales bacterium]|nr:branched-chain amino acid ABC transporter permease [Aggregatilineales bacterium]